ncbi:MAG: ABC transporter substrate-binding protein [Chloroflexi bacterium]|nr:ABC transporter substrate-binding protein [Chloroflexota bacterium]
MHTGKLIASSLAVLGLLVASCAPATAPAATPKPAAPAAATATPAATPEKPTAPAAKPAALSPTAKPASEQPGYGGIMTVGAGGDPPSLDPHQETTSYTLSVVGPSYNSLAQHDPNAWPEAKIVSDLAQKWDVSADGVTYTFHFPEGIRWHDGAPFTSADARFSIQRMAAPPRGTRSPRSDLFEVVDQVETPDPRTLTLRLKSRSASFVPILAMGWNVILPQHVVQQKGDMKKDVVGTGPFKFKAYSPGVSYEVVKNEGYFRRGRPYLDGIKWYTIRDGATRFSALRTGRIALIEPTPGISASQANLLEKSVPEVQVQRTPYYAMLAVLLNVRMKPWNDVRVRQAMNLALDRQSLIDVALEGRGVIGGLLFPGGLWDRPREELLQKPGYRRPTESDIARAKGMLGEAGFPTGLSSPLLARMDLVESHRSAELVKREMAKLGIDLSIELKESAGFYDALDRHSFSAAVMTIGVHVDDPDVVFPVIFATNASRNYMGYSDPKVDELIARQSTILDKAERTRVVRQAEDIIIGAVPAIVPCWLVRVAANSRNLRDYKMAPGGGVNKMMQDVWLAK